MKDKIQTELDNSLFAAVYEGNLDRVKQLIEHFNVDINATNQKGQTALAYAISNVIFNSGNFAIVKYFLEETESHFDFNNIDLTGMLNVAARMMRLDDVRYLVELLGADVNAVNVFGHYSLSSALREVYSKPNETSHVDALATVNYLIGANADVCKLLLGTDTILHRTVEFDFNLDVFEALLEGLNPSITRVEDLPRDSQNKSPCDNEFAMPKAKELLENFLRKRAAQKKDNKNENTNIVEHPVSISDHALRSANIVSIDNAFHNLFASTPHNLQINQSIPSAPSHAPTHLVRTVNVMPLVGDSPITPSPILERQRQNSVSTVSNVVVSNNSKSMMKQLLEEAWKNSSNSSQVESKSGLNLKTKSEAVPSQSQNKFALFTHPEAGERLDALDHNEEKINHDVEGMIDDMDEMLISPGKDPAIANSTARAVSQLGIFDYLENREAKMPIASGSERRTESIIKHITAAPKNNNFQTQEKQLKKEIRPNNQIQFGTCSKHRVNFMGTRSSNSERRLASNRQELPLMNHSRNWLRATL